MHFPSRRSEAKSPAERNWQRSTDRRGHRVVARSDAQPERPVVSFVKEGREGGLRVAKEAGFESPALHARIERIPAPDAQRVGCERFFALIRELEHHAVDRCTKRAH